MDQLPEKITVTRDLALKGGKHTVAGTILRVGTDVDEKDATQLLDNNGARETTDADVEAAKAKAKAGAAANADAEKK